MKYAKIFALGWACCIFPLEALTLEQFVGEVRSANPGLAAARQRYSAGAHRVKPAATWEDPFIAAGSDENAFMGESNPVVRYQVNQTIPFPGKMDARGKVVEAQAATLKADSEMTEREVVIAATQLFFQAIMNERALALNAEHDALLRDTAQSEKIRYNTGGASHHLWLLAQAEQEILRTERLRLEKERMTLRAQMNELRNLSAEADTGPLELPERPGTESLPAFTDVLEAQPEYKAILAQNAFAGENLRQSKQGYLPDFMVQGMMMQPQTGNGHSNWGVMVGVTMPLYFFRKQSELVKAAEMEISAADQERLALLNRLKAEWFDAQQQYKTANEVNDLYQNKVLPITKMAVDSAKSDYRMRKVSLREFTDTLRIYKKQELEATAARLDIELAKLRIRELVANPVALRLSPRSPSLFGAPMQNMSDSGMGTSAPMRTGKGMRPPKPGASPAKGGSMGGM